MSDQLPTTFYSDHFQSTQVSLFDIEFNDTLSLDIFDILAGIVYSDFDKQRNEYLINRNIVCIDVNNLEILLPYVSIFEELASFMTGELWRVELKETLIKKRIYFELEKLSWKPDSICLFSGGLDSLAGVCEELRMGLKTLLINYQTNGHEMKVAKSTFEDYLVENFNLVQFKKAKYTKYNHHTQRTRSLIFIGCAFIYSRLFNIKEIKIYENGIMSFNPNVANIRKTSKTTHPKSIYLLNRIMQIVNIRVLNPFIYMTKGEVISRIDKQLLPNIKNTVTCSRNPRIKYHSDRGNKYQCGYCISCILRQIGMNKIKLNSIDSEYITNLNEYIFPESRWINDVNLISIYSKNQLYRLNYKNSTIRYFRFLKSEFEKGKLFGLLNIRSIYFNEPNYMELVMGLYTRFIDELNNYLEVIDEKRE